MSNSSVGASQKQFLAADQSERRLWWRWLGVTTLGLFIMPLSSSWTSLALGLATLTIGQWLLLRPRLANAAWWLLATPIFLLLGVSIGGPVAGDLQDQLDNVASSSLGIAPLEPGRKFSSLLIASTIASTLTGAVLGLGQWLVLRRRYFAAIWILATIIGMCGLFIPEIFVHPYLANLLGGAWMGAVTGTALLLCLRRPKNVADQATQTGRTTSDLPRKKRSVFWRILAGFAVVVLVIFGLGLTEMLHDPYMRAIMSESVLQDYVQAYKWFYIAGTPNGRARVARNMSSEQIAEAERMATEWLAAHPEYQRP
jgi:hypothetical protein